MIDPNKIADLVKKTLKGSGYKVKMYTDEGDSTLDPREARRFFTVPDKVMITFEDTNNLIKFHKSNSVALDEISDIHKSIKNLASKYNMDFVMREFGKEIEPKNYVSDSIQTINDNGDDASEIKEALSKLAGTNLKSRQTLDDNTKIIIKHSKSIDEEVKGSRSRHIESIYIENSQGERFKYPFKNMSGARAMARHIHENGTPYDNVGKTIISVSEDNVKLSKFLRYSRNNGLSEANQDTIDAVSNKVLANKKFLHTLSNVKTYEATVNSIEEKIEEQQELDITGLKDAFTKRVFDESMEEVLPMVQKIVDEANVAEAKKDPYAGMSMLDRAKNAELGPDMSGEYSSKNIKKFSSKQAEIVYKVTELNTRVKDDELNRFVTNGILKLDDGKPVTRDEVDVIKALIARGKELGAYEESVKTVDPMEAEVAEWAEDVAGDNALFSEEPAQEVKEDDEQTKTIKVNKDIQLAGDSIWDKRNENMTQMVHVKDITINTDEDGYMSVSVEHDGPWDIYTDSGFEEEISNIIGTPVSFSEQGMQDDGMAHLEGNIEESVQENRMGFSDLEKLGAENASKVDMECKRRGSADMEPGEADQLRYKVAKEMGLLEDTVKEESSVRITDLEDLNLYDEEDIKAADSMSAEELKAELIGDLQHLHTSAVDGHTDDDHIADEMGDYWPNMHRKADDKTLEVYAMARDLMGEDPAGVIHQTEKLLRVLGSDTKESLDIETIRSRAGIESAEVDEDAVDEDNAFNSAAAAAKKAGKDHFMFNGKKYKVTMDKDTADDLTEEPKTMCKHCGDEIYKPTTDCECDSQDPNGENWIKIDADGDGDTDIAVANEDKDLERILRLAGV